MTNRSFAAGGSSGCRQSRQSQVYASANYEKTEFHDKMLLTKPHRKEKGLLMENIIHQIVMGTVAKVLENYEVNGLERLDKMSDTLKVLSDSMALQLLTAFIESSDKSICESKSERKEDGISIHERNVPRTILTSLGWLTYNRSYFKTPVGMSYMLDDMLGVSPYERIDAGVSAKLVNNAALHSYGRSASIVCGDKISRQSAWNKAMNTGEVAYTPEQSEDTPEILHIFADEDHVSLQEGGSTIVPLVTVCGGKHSVSRGRNKLIEPFHIHGYGMDKETLWNYVYALCAVKYDMSRVKCVHIYGDGASWIKGGHSVFSNSIFMLDVFHYKKRMRSLFSGELGSRFAPSAHGAISRNDKNAFESSVHLLKTGVLEKMHEGKARNRRPESIDKHSGYILNNWDSIQNTKLPGAIGSCTEAMVSHVLSERLSRNPMGWSKKGLSKMAMFRVFAINGGKVEPIDTLSWKHSDKRNRVAGHIEKYEKIVKLQHDEIFKGAKNRTLFETDSKISGKTTGTKVVLDALGKLRDVS